MALKTTPITPGTGENIVLDSVASASGDVPVSKLMFGDAGTNDGLASAAHPFPIAIYDASGNLLGVVAHPLVVAGNVAAGASDAGNPLKIGGKASATIPTAVTDGQRADAYHDLRGRQFVAPSSHAAAAANVNAPSSNTAAVVTYSAGAAGVSHVIGGIAWSFSADPTAAANLKVEDGSGVVVFSIDVTKGGPGFFLFPEPLRGTAATAMIITLAAGGTGISGKLSILGKKAE